MKEPERQIANGKSPAADCESGASKTVRGTWSRPGKFALRSLRTRVQFVVALALVVNCATAGAQCFIDPTTGSRVCPTREASARAGSSAHCRITVGDGSTGSGALVERTDDTGLVLTCSHLFDGSEANIVVAFPGGQRFAARLVARDRAHDLAAVLIRRPSGAPVEVSESEPAGALAACGFGPAGQFRRVSGQVTGQATAEGASFAALVLSCAVRPGDSGGAVLDTAGRLVGVVWGARDGSTYATCGRPVREFLARVLGKERGVSNEERVESSRPAQLDPRSSEGPQIDWHAWSKEIESRVEALAETKQDKGDYLRPGDLNGYLMRKELPDASVLATREEVSSAAAESTSRLELLREHLHTRIEERVGQVLPAIEERIVSAKPGLFAGLSFGKLIVGALGLSGPLAAAVIVAGGLAGRRTKSRVERQESRAGREAIGDAPTLSTIVVDSPPLPQRTVPETHYVPFEKDSFARAHQWASEQVARKYPGATEVLQAQESLIRQHIAGS